MKQKDLIRFSVVYRTIRNGQLSSENLQASAEAAVADQLPPGAHPVDLRSATSTPPAASTNLLQPLFESPCASPAPPPGVNLRPLLISPTAPSSTLSSFRPPSSPTCLLQVPTGGRHEEKGSCKSPQPAETDTMKQPSEAASEEPSLPSPPLTSMHASMDNGVQSLEELPIPPQPQESDKLGGFFIDQCWTLWLDGCPALHVQFWAFIV